MDNNKRGGRDLIPAIITMCGIFVSFGISIYFGIIQPKNEIKKNIVIICTNIEKEIKHNDLILNMGNECIYSNFYSDENEIEDSSNLLIYLYGNLYLSVSTEYWDNNSQYLAIHSPQDYSKYWEKYFYFKELSKIYSDYNILDTLNLSNDKLDEDLERLSIINQITQFKINQLMEYYNSLQID